MQIVVEGMQAHLCTQLMLYMEGREQLTIDANYIAKMATMAVCTPDPGEAALVRGAYGSLTELRFISNLYQRTVVVHVRNAQEPGAPIYTTTVAPTDLWAAPDAAAAAPPVQLLHHPGSEHYEVLVPVPQVSSACEVASWLLVACAECSRCSGAACHRRSRGASCQLLQARTTH
jgi:hypothetical protein